MPTLDELTGGLFDGHTLGLASSEVASIEADIHPRHQIVSYVAALLRAESNEPDRIIEARFVPPGAEELPLCLVYGRRDRHVRKLVEGSPGIHLMEIRLAAEVVLSRLDSVPSEELERQGNAAAHLVELVVGRDAGLGGLAHALMPAGSQIVGNADAVRPTLGVQVSFDVEYVWDLQALAVDDLTKIHIDYDIEGGDPVDAEDDVTF